MAFRGDIASTTLPGRVDGLLRLASRYSPLELSELLAPGLRLASDGFPVSPTLAEDSAGLAPETRRLAFRAPGPPRTGQRLTAPGLARTLQTIAAEGRSGFYEGGLGRELRAHAAELYTPDDLRRPAADWVEPFSVQAFGHTLWTTPPNSQGYLALSSAWIADAVGVPADPSDGRWAALLVQASRQAAFDRVHALHEHADGHDLLSPARLAPRVDAIGDRAGAEIDQEYRRGDTTCICAVDRDGQGGVSDHVHWRGVRISDRPARRRGLSAQPRRGLLPDRRTPR